MLAGVEVEDWHVPGIARLLRQRGRESTAARLDDAYDRKAQVLALSLLERDHILTALIDCPDGLGELRATLLQQRLWRRAEGLNRPVRTREEP